MCFAQQQLLKYYSTGDFFVVNFGGKELGGKLPKHESPVSHHVNREYAERKKNNNKKFTLPSPRLIFCDIIWEWAINEKQSIMVQSCTYFNYFWYSTHLKTSFKDYITLLANFSLNVSISFVFSARVARSFAISSSILRFASNACNLFYRENKIHKSNKDVSLIKANYPYVIYNYR